MQQILHIVFIANIQGLSAIIAASHLLYDQMKFVAERIYKQQIISFGLFLQTIFNLLTLGSPRKILAAVLANIRHRC